MTLKNTFARILICILSFFQFFYFHPAKGQNKIIDESYLYQDLPFSMEIVKKPVFSDNQVNIKDFDAVSDGVTLNTKAISLAIDAVVAKGGGRVVIPEGLWLSGPIVLKSNINLHIEKGALVTFTSDYKEYPMVQTWFEGQSCWRAMSPIYANNAENIAVTGEGIIDGNGDAWRPVKRNNVIESRWKQYLGSGGVLSDNGTTWYPTEGALKGSKEKILAIQRTEKDYEEIKVSLRPVLLNFVNCKRILLDGVTFRNPPAWTIHPVLSENITIRNIKVDNEEWQANADALDIESCRNVVIYNCVFDAGDDAICMKSGKNEDGRKRGVPTENVIISNCIVYKGHGGFVVGSEMSGGIRNIKVSHCTFIGTDNGLRFKSTRGRGGVVENIYISDITMLSIEKDAVLYDLYYAISNPREVQTPKADVTTPEFKNIYMKNIVCKGANRAILFQGLPEMNIKNIHIENAIFETRTGVFCSDATQITMKNVQIYPRKLPAIDIYNANNLLVENFKSYETKDTLINISGQKTENIIIKSNDKPNIIISQEVKAGSVKMLNQTN